jgi:hypothetical protein
MHDDARRKAWETRRAKYGTKGHGGSYSRCSDAPLVERNFRKGLSK